MLKSSLWFPRVQWQNFQIQQLCIHTQCSVILACHWWYKLFVHWWMKGIYFASFYFRVWDLTREIRENKNPAKISTYTVVTNAKLTLNGQFRIQTFLRLFGNIIARWSILDDRVMLLGLNKVETMAEMGFKHTTLQSWVQCCNHCATMTLFSGIGHVYQCNFSAN